jgi:hypothetical protein
MNPTVVGICAMENGYKSDLSISSQGIGGLLKENNHRLDLIPEKAFPDFPSLAIIGIGTQKTVVGQNYSTNITTTIANYGPYTQTTNITIYANTTPIQTKTTTLNVGATATLTFIWDTTGFAYGNYTISSIAWPIMGETETIGDSLVDGVVCVGVPGDVDGNHIVNMLDLYNIALVFGTTIGQPNHKPNCDIDDNGIINMLDLYIAALRFGQHGP